MASRKRYCRHIVARLQQRAEVRLAGQAMQAWLEYHTDRQARQEVRNCSAAALQRRPCCFHSPSLLLHLCRVELAVLLAMCDWPLSWTNC